MRKLVAYTREGRRIGESHPKAKLLDCEVRLLLDLRDEGFSMQWLADKFGISKGCVQHICAGSTRNHTPHLIREEDD